MNKEMKIAAMLSYITMGLGVIIGLVTTPLILETLGQNEYGVYTLFGSLIATLTMFDLGLNNTVVRYVSRYQAEKKQTEQARFLGLIIIIYLIISLCILALGYVIYQRLPTMFPALKKDELYLAEQIFIVLIASLAISLPGGMFTAIANAYERFLFVKVINFTKLIIRTLMLFGVIYLYGDALSIVIMDSIIAIFTICIMAYYSIYKIKIRFKFDNITLNHFKKVFFYSIWIFVYAIYQQIQWESGKLILGRNIGAEEVSIYAIGIMLALYYSSLATSILSMFLPKANQLVVGENNISNLMDVGKSISDIIFKILTPVIIMFSFFGDEFILEWLGTEYYHVYTITLTIMILYFPALLQGFMGSVLQALNKVKERAIISLFGAIIGGVVSLYLVHEYSIFGVLIGMTVGWVITQITLNVFYLYMGIPAYKMLYISPERIILILVFISVNFIIDGFVNNDSVIQLLVKLSLSMLFNIVVYLLYKYNFRYKIKTLTKVEY